MFWSSQVSVYLLNTVHVLKHPVLFPEVQCAAAFWFEQFCLGSAVGMKTCPGVWIAC